MALKQKGMCHEIAGYGRNEATLKEAIKRGVIDSYDLDPARACDGADLVALCTPVETFVPLAGQIAGSLKKGALVIDMGSVKGSLVDALDGLMPESVNFVGCHPIAGSERSGLDAAVVDLYKGALCVITPTANTNPGALDSAKALWSALGARVELMAPDAHDMLYGAVSHFPHLAAFALVLAANDARPDGLRYAGKGFMDSTRIAKSSPSLWSNICTMNADNMLAVTEAFQKRLTELSGYIKKGDAKGLEGRLAQAQALRQSIEG